jgi:uncharacterized OB-fold protein
VDLRTPPPEWIELNADQWTQPFWDAAAEHRLVCARCRACGTFRMPPSPFCPKCRSQELDWPELTGRGTVFTYTIVHHPVMPALAESVPYAVAAVDLEGVGGVRLIGNLVDVDTDAIRVGMAVDLVWADIREGLSVPRFRPAPTTG